MDALERNLLWLGAEDYTGLWQAVVEPRDDADLCSIHAAREQARRAIDSLLARGFVELFVCQEPLDNGTVEIVPPGKQSVILDEQASWTAPGEGGKSLRFATTDQGFAAYQKETGWAAT
jgi:hypothetical protein